MEKEKIIGQLEELLFNFENFESVETTEDDVEALKFAIDELKKVVVFLKTTTNESN